MITIANPWHHAVSSARKWGGAPEDYLEVHTWFDLSKEHLSDFRHRALRHHTQGIFEAERVFGPTITVGVTKRGRCEFCEQENAIITALLVDDPDQLVCETCHADKRLRTQRLTKEIPTRWIGEQHVEEDLGRIPTLADWLTCIVAEPWMNRSRRLSRELEQEEAPS